MNEKRVREPGRSLPNATWICKNKTKMPLMPHSQIIYFNKPNLKISLTSELDIIQKICK